MTKRDSSKTGQTNLNHEGGKYNTCTPKERWEGCSAEAHFNCDVCIFYSKTAPTLVGDSGCVKKKKCSFYLY